MLYQDEFVAAFMDLFPVVPGHLLVIPNMHAVLLGDLPEELSLRVFSLGRRLGAALRQSKLRAESIGYYMADGPAAGQVVRHVHLHVIPRFAGDGAGIGLHRQAPMRAKRAELDTQAADIQAAMNGRSST